MRASRRRWVLWLAMLAQSWNCLDLLCLALAICSADLREITGMYRRRNVITRAAAENWLRFAYDVDRVR
eukprot:COSAG01_NODE_5158_length_4445_cov_12.910953_1_plen_69_part_00